MKQHLEEEAELRSYLLGELTLEEQVSVEARLFLDDEYLSLLRAVEDELIDDYAFDELAVSDREKLQARLLSKPGRREDVRIARALKRHLSQEGESVTPSVAPAADTRPDSAPGEPPLPPKKGPLSFLLSLFVRRPVASFALAAAALIILSTIIWLSFESARRQSQSRPMQAQAPAPEQAEPAERQQREPAGNLQANESHQGEIGEPANRQNRSRNGAEGEANRKRANEGQQPGSSRGGQPPTRQTPAGVATFTLLPGGVVRGGGQTGKVIVTSEIGTVKLKLPLTTADDYRGYRAMLQTGGRTVRVWDNLESEGDEELGRVVTVPVPAKLLRPQTYQVKLSGLTADLQAIDITPYTFQVEIK